jgi:hypothetical protein
MKIKRLMIGVVISVLFYQFNSFAQVDTTISIDPTSAYLRTNDDPCLDAIPIELSTLGISVGDYLRLAQLGDFNNGPGGDIYKRMIGVFSSNDSLLDSSLLHRVPGAIDAGEDFVTSPTYVGNLPTDIPEDFWIDTVIVQVPDSALFLFVSTHDSWYWDNSDPDSDFAISIKITSAPIKISDKSENNILNNYQLYQNYPNPFNPITQVSYRLPRTSDVKIEVFNILGQQVSTLINSRKTPGYHVADFDGSNLASGIYLYRIHAGNFVQVKKMVLMK